MRKEERNAMISCIILLVCALGWGVLTFIAWRSSTQLLPVKILCTTAALGWFALFVMRAIQWHAVKK